MLRRLVATLFAFMVLGAARLGKGEDYFAVRATAEGDTEESAVKDAYYFAFDRTLTGVAGYEPKISARFRKDFEENFEEFKHRYFTPDTATRCAREESGRHLCEVDGAVQMRVLRADAATRLRPLFAQPVVVLSAAKSADPRSQYIVNQLEGAFEKWGLQLVMEGMKGDSVEHNRVDFSLGIYEVLLTNLDDPKAYDPYSHRLSGAVTVRFKLSNPKSGKELATVPVVVTGNEAGLYPEALKEGLKDQLGKRAADEIARNVNEAIVSYQSEVRKQASK
jgi:hypothetical protein